MITIYNGRNYTAVKFGELAVGETFIGEPALATLRPRLGDPALAETTPIYLKTNGGYNCVNLNNGEMRCVADTMPVLRVDTKMIWNLKGE